MSTGKKVFVPNMFFIGLAHYCPESPLRSALSEPVTSSFDWVTPAAPSEKRKFSTFGQHSIQIQQHVGHRGPGGGFGGVEFAG